MRTASAVLAVAMAAGLAHGAEIIGNILAPQVSSTVFGTGSSSIFKAVGFTMGADAYDVTQVTLAWDTNAGGGGNPVVAIYDGAGAPATELMVFNNPANIATPGIVGDLVFTASAPLTLQPNTTYWVHVRSEPMTGPSFRWLSTSNANPPTGAGATFVTYNFNGNPSSFYNRFLLEGDLAGAGCDPDLTTGALPGQPGFGVPNGILNNDDFFYYLFIFSNNDPAADLTTGAVPGQPGYGVPNGVINNDDFFYYLSIFSAGC